MTNVDSLDQNVADFFVAGGTLLPDSPSYVKRAADDELFARALAGEFCYILTARQMGKSSLMIRTARRLQAEGVKTVIIDLTQIGTVSIDQWYLGLLSEIKRRLRLSVDPVNWWQERSMLGHVQRFTDFLRDVVLAEISGNVAIFIDEIDTTLKLDFRDDFFAAIRAMYNARAETPEFARLTFALLGVASPSDLIKDRVRTPFNIGQEISLQRFNLDDARVLEQGLEQAYPRCGTAIFNRIFYWTNGHPYLTQKLCQAIVEKAYQECDDNQIDTLVKSLFLSEEARRETNLQFVRDNILTHPHRRDLLRLYSAIYKGKIVQDNKQSVVQNQLKLSGLVVVEDGKLYVHNAIYQQVFNLAWVRKNTAVNRAPIVVGVMTVAVVLAVGAIVYDLWVGVQTQDEIANFYQTRSSRERLAHLATLFNAQGLFGSTDYDYKAIEIFYGMPGDEQLALFINYGKDVDTPHLLAVIRGLYVTLADTDGTDSTRLLLQVMLDALSDLEQTDETDALKNEIVSWLNGRDLAKLGQYDLALDAYNNAIAQNSENPATLYERARILIQLSRYEDALRDLDQVLGIARSSPLPTPTPSLFAPTTLLLSTLTTELVSTISATPNITVTSVLLPNSAAETPAPGLPSAITSNFATTSQTLNAIRELINNSPGLVKALAGAPVSQYRNLNEFGLVPTPSKTLSIPSTFTAITSAPTHIEPTDTDTPLLILPPGPTLTQTTTSTSTRTPTRPSITTQVPPATTLSVTTQAPPATTLSVSVAAECVGPSQVRIALDASGGLPPYTYFPAQSFTFEIGSSTTIDLQVDSTDGQSWVAKFPLRTCP